MFYQLRFLSTLLILLAFSCAQEKNGFDWQEGDILFQDGDCGDFCDAIRKVTEGYNGHDFSHNGMLIQEGENWFVLEAIGTGVSKTSLEDFLNRYLDENGEPKVMIGRLKEEYQWLVPRAIEVAKIHLGKPYDAWFDFENDAFYCSELIHFSFKSANGGKDVFTPKPMTYQDPDTGELFPVWETYFEKLGVPVPEGKLGLNPGGMSMEPVLEIYFLK